MTVSEMLAQLEKPDFCAHVGLASGYKQFKRFLMTYPAVTELLATHDSQAVVAQVFARAQHLVRDRGQEEYSHPWDAVIAAYCWVLKVKSAPVAQQLASEILTTGGFWW